MEYPKNFDRHLTLISEAIAKMTYQDQPNTSEAEIKIAAHNFAEFFCLLKRMDEEQKVKNEF